MNQEYTGSVNSEYANIKGNQKEVFNIRRNRDFSFMVAAGPIEDPLCDKCLKPITGHKLIINKKIYHYETCYPNS